MPYDAAIIGGTGIAERLAALGGDSLNVPTSFGLLRSKVFELRGKKVVAVSRHEAGHKLAPHQVQYRAIATGLASIGVRYCISTAAVGCLVEEWHPGSLVLCTDFIDLSSRNLTLFEQDVRHIDLSTAFDPYLRSELLRAADRLGMFLIEEGVYVNSPGPRYETPAEIKMIRKIGGELVGMTVGSEAIAMREAGVKYASLAIVSNLAAGMSSAPLSHGDVTRAVNLAGESVVKLVLATVSALE